MGQDGLTRYFIMKVLANSKIIVNKTNIQKDLVMIDFMNKPTVINILTFLRLDAVMFFMLAEQHPKANIVSFGGVEFKRVKS